MKSPNDTAANVLVACDFSDAADEAIRQADAWARRAGARFSAVHVVPDMVRANPLFPQRVAPEIAGEMDLEQKAAEALLERITAITGRSAADVHVHIAVGSADAAVVREAEVRRADVIVVGATGRSGLARLFLGSTAERVARLAHCSVLIARPSPPSGWVLAATDLSTPALPGVHAAVEEARRRAAKLAVIHAVDIGPAVWASSAGVPFGASPVPVPHELVEQMRKTAEESLRALTADVSPTILVDEGPAASVIDKAAASLPAELIVVATHGRTGLSRIALGSVTEKVIRAAPCSVLVVRR